jgi:hypothetical protein
MTNGPLPYKLAAVFPDERTAAAAVDALDAATLDGVRVLEFAPDTSGVDRAVGPAAGVTAATAPALYVSAPVVGSLVVLGYGALIDAAAGTIRGLRLRESLLADLLKDALRAGCYVVLLLAASSEARRHAEAVISVTLSDHPAIHT